MTTVEQPLKGAPGDLSAGWSDNAIPGTPSAELARLVAGSILDLPLPGGGGTWTRFRALADLGSRDLSLARLAEGHVDAVAVLVEARHAFVPQDARLGVWAAGPLSTLTAHRRGGRWQLNGIRRWCSGAGSLTHALVTASVDSHCQLFLVDLGRSGVSVVPDSWPAVGMAGSDTLDVRFDEVDLGAESAVGARDFYLNRPGFWHGALGVAAVWWGGARAVARPLLTPKDGASPHRLAHAGAVRARLWSTEGTLEAAARRVDEDPSDLTSDARALAGVVRHVVETAATEVLDRVGRATGAEPLGHDAAHARRVADLTVYLRQSHAEADLAVLEGHFLAGGSLRGWT